MRPYSTAKYSIQDLISATLSKNLLVYSVLAQVRPEGIEGEAPLGMFPPPFRVVRTTDTRIFSEQISQPYLTWGNPIKRLAADS
jgi:hypothetical protein